MYDTIYLLTCTTANVAPMLLPWYVLQPPAPAPVPVPPEPVATVPVSKLHVIHINECVSHTRSLRITALLHPAT
jgi:hypothetical protein